MAISIIPKQFDGQSHRKSMRRDMLSYLEHASQYGDFLKIPVPFSSLLLLNHPDLVQEVLVKQSRDFHKPFSVKYTANQFFGDNLFTSDGELWRVLKKLIQPGFDLPRLETYGNIMIAKTQRRLEEWSVEGHLEMTYEMRTLTLQTTSQCFFGLNWDKNESGESILEFIELFFKRISSIPVPAWIPIPTNVRMKSLTRQGQQSFKALIDQRRQANDKLDDMLSILINAQQYDQTGTLTDAQIINEVSNLFTAGYEVTAYSLAFTLYLLATHSEVEKKVRQELESVVGDRPLTVADIEQLSYLNQVIQEAMRLYPVAPILGRQSIEDVELQGHRIPKKSLIIIAPWILHRREDIFPEPLTFKPERFHEGHQIPKYAYLPFSGGPRACIGQGFAMMQMRINLAMMMQRYRFRLAPDYQFKPIFQFNTRPQGGLPMILDAVA